MSTLETKVVSFIKRHQLIEEHDRVLVGVSGGPDSLALLHFLNQNKERFGYSIYCAHVDHMFRGLESYKDMKYVESLCQQWNIPFFGTRINVPEEMARRPGSPESIARELRYEFFASIMKKENFNVLALGHHGDDQIETILMRLTRGTTVGAAAGIRVKRPFSSGILIRPFLCVTRDEIIAYCKQHSLEPVYDATNEMDIYTRNRFRKTILPFLKAENPQVHIHFQRYSEHLADDEDYLHEQAEKLFKDIVVVKEDQLILQRDLFVSAPRPLQRRVIQILLNYLYKKDISLYITYTHIDMIMELLEKQHPSKKIHLPQGLIASLSYDQCIFSFQNEEPAPYFFKWNKGETIVLPNGAKFIMIDQHDGLEDGMDCFYLPKTVSFPLYIRTRKEGDRIQLKGKKRQTQKIKSLFINEKIPLHLRDEWPIVTDQNDVILWVPLLKKSRFEACNLERKEAILLKYILNNNSRRSFS